MACVRHALTHLKLTHFYKYQVKIGGFLMKHADLISQMTLEEKVAFCSGSDYWHTASIERLGIPSILWSDGPHGIRNSVGTHDKDEPKKKDKKGEGMDALLGGIPAVCYPTAATTACSWIPSLSTVWASSSARSA